MSPMTSTPLCYLLNSQELVNDTEAATTVLMFQHAWVHQGGGGEPHRLDAVAEAGAVLEAGVRERFVEAHVLRGALRQHVHLRAARRRRQLVPVVLRGTGMTGRSVYMTGTLNDVNGNLVMVGALCITLSLSANT